MLPAWADASLVTTLELKLFSQDTVLFGITLKLKFEEDIKAKKTKTG